MPSIDRAKTTASLKSIGEVQLKFISIADSREFYKIIDSENLTNKEKVRNILFHQLRSPRLTREEFFSLPGDEIKILAEVFKKSEDYSFKEFQDTGHFYDDFVKSLKISYEEELEKAKKMMAPFIEQAEKLTQFGKHIKQISKSYYFPETLKQFNKALLQFQRINISRFGILAKESTQIWNTYFSISEAINNSALSLLLKQSILPQKSSAKDLQDIFTVAKKNEKIFGEKVKILPDAEKPQVTITQDFIEKMLLKVKRNIENCSFSMFWKAKGKGELYQNPERIAQGHVIGLLNMGLPDRLIVADQQTRAGAGIIDIILTFYNGKELERIILELKVFKKRHKLNDGIEQTFKYMETKNTLSGYRIILNATGTDLFAKIHERDIRKLKDIAIDINPISPSDLD